MSVKQYVEMEVKVIVSEGRRMPPKRVRMFVINGDVPQKTSSGKVPRAEPSPVLFREGAPKSGTFRLGPGASGSGVHPALHGPSRL